MKLMWLLVFCQVSINVFADNNQVYGGSRGRGGSRRQRGGRTSHRGYRSHENHYSHSLGYHHKGKSNVIMPSGGSAKIGKPHESRYTCSKNSDLVIMRPTDNKWKIEYDTVKREMERTNMDSTVTYDIVRIQKIFNSCLWRKYSYRRDVIYDEVQLTNERMLFHGSTAARDLALHGFDERYAKITGRFGAGVYFADHSSKSHSYSAPQRDGTRYMLLCRVTLGKTYMARAQFNRISNPPVGYHSVLGARGDTEYIVYLGEQAYPAYIITYKSHNNYKNNYG